MGLAVEEKIVFSSNDYMIPEEFLLEVLQVI